MSVETLVLLALFIALPLIQLLIRAMRQPNRSLPEPAETRSPKTLARTAPPEITVPPLPDTTPHAASDGSLESGRAPAPQDDRPVTSALTPGRAMEQRTAGLGTRRDLRRAIVLVAILGPSRASIPDDWPEQAGRP
jgi:hypothetical protein